MAACSPVTSIWTTRGLKARAVNDRWLSDERLAEVFPKSEAIAKLMDRTGYDTFWLAEHHFQREGY